MSTNKIRSIVRYSRI